MAFITGFHWSVPGTFFWGGGIFYGSHVCVITWWDTFFRLSILLDTVFIRIISENLTLTAMMRLSSGGLVSMDPVYLVQLCTRFSGWLNVIWLVSGPNVGTV